MVGDSAGYVRRGTARLVVAICAVALLSPTADASAQAVGTGGISGTVLVPGGAAPATMYEVDLFDDSGTMLDSTCTDVNGDYSFAGLDDGSYRVFFSGGSAGGCTEASYAAGWFPGFDPHNAYPSPQLFKYSQSVTVSNGGVTTGVNAELDNGHSISGTVRTAGNGVGNVDVKVLDVDLSVISSVCSAVDGTYTVPRLEDALYYVEFQTDATCGAAPGGPYQTQFYNGQASPVSASYVDFSNGDPTDVDADLIAGSSYLLTVTRSGSGSGSVTSSPNGIDCPNGPCMNTFAAPSGSTTATVVLTATPDPGSQFTGWLGACSGMGTCTVAMTGDTSVEAVFAPAPPPIKHTLTAMTAGSGSGSVTSSVGGISCPGTCSADLDDGSTVTLTATPASGSTFAGWSGGGCSGTGTCQVTLGADTTVTATFNPTTGSGPTTAALSVTTAGTGSGHVTTSAGGISCPGTCSARLALGAAVTLTATPSAGSTFAGWSGGGCSGTGACTLTLSADTTVTATFNPATGNPPPPPKPTCSLAVVTAHVTSRIPGRTPKTGRLTLRISCDQAATVSVTGVLAERLTRHKLRKIRLKTIHAPITAGREGTFVVKVPAAAITGLKHRRRESVVLTLVASNGAGQARVTAKVGRLRF